MNSPAIERRRVSQTRLDSWKSIAQHFGRTCRTVQRWHVEYGLPVHRLGGNRGPIFAYTVELDDWLKNRGQSPLNEPEEIKQPVLIHSHKTKDEPVQSNKIVDEFPTADTTMNKLAKTRSAELVTTAYRMWETLSQRNICKISQLFRDAIDLDHSNAAAFAGLSHALIAGGMLGLVWTPMAIASARSALIRALEIDPGLPEAKCALSWLKMISTRDWQGARRDFDELLLGQFASIRSIIGRALLYIAEGRLREASSLLLKAVHHNALSTPETEVYCWSKYLIGDYADTWDQIEDVRGSGRSGLLLDAVEALTFIQLQGPEACIQQVETMAGNAPRNALLRGALGYAYGMAGQDQKASEILDSIRQSEGDQNSRAPYSVALILLGLNRKREAVQYLEQSYREGSLWSLGFRSDPLLKVLSNDSHFQMLMSKISYPNSDHPSSVAS